MIKKTVTSRFVLKGDNQLSGAFSKAQKQLGDIGKKAALFGVAAVAAGAAIVRSQAAAIDSLAKTAAVVGVSIEALQGYRHAAELAGIENIGIDDSLRRLGRRAGEFANSGAGPAAKAFEMLGIEIRDTNGEVKGTEQLFEEIIVAMGGVETDLQRAALAAQLFGDDFGPKLIPLINQGIAGISGARNELEQLGVLISDSEAAGVERMNDAMTTAGEVGTGIAGIFTAALAPAITAIAEEFIAASKESRGFSDDVVNSADLAGRGIFFVADVVHSVGIQFRVMSQVGIIAFEVLKVGVLGLADSIVNGPGRAINLLLEQFDRIPGVDIDFQFGDPLPILKQNLAISEDIISQAASGIQAILMETLPSTAFNRRLVQIREALAAFQRVAGGSTDAPTIVPVDTTVLAARNKLESEYASLIKSTRTAQEAHNLQITRVDELFISGVIPSAEAYADILDRINDKFEKSQTKVEGLDQFAIQAARNMESAFADFLFDPFDEGLKGMLRGFLDMIRRMAAEAAASAVLNALIGAIGGAAGGSGGGGGGFGPAMAEGGDFPGTKPFLVGERGPEVIFPRGAGTVIPNNQLGGNSVVVHIDARETDNPGKLLALVPVIQAQIEQSLSIKSRRGYL